MTNEDIQRTIRFILEQQAQTAVTMGQVSGKMDTMAVNMGKLTERVDALGVKVDRTADSVIALLAIAEIHEREITPIGS
jgi:hypothetical protein